jgi:hypothetical protein
MSIGSDREGRRPSSTPAPPNLVDQLDLINGVIEQARRNALLALIQAAAALLLLVLAVLLDYPGVLDLISGLLPTTFAPHPEVLWVVKWSFAIGAFLYLIFALYFLLISMAHLRRARFLRYAVVEDAHR